MDPESINFIDLRQILGFLDQSSFLLASRALILQTWISNNNFCSICGKIIHLIRRRAHLNAVVTLFQNTRHIPMHHYFDT